MSKIFEIKIKLLKSKPSVWRKLQIRQSCTFWDLHVVIRDSIEWTDGQPHYFKINYNKNKNIIIKSYLDDYENNKFSLSWNVPIKKYLTNKYKIYYVYGTEENHVHLITLEKILYKNRKIKYPICLSGKGIPYEESEYDETTTETMVRESSVFKVDQVVVTEGRRALEEHKIFLFDEIFS